MRRYLLVMLCVSAFFAFPAAAQEQDCPGAPATRLNYGVEARVSGGAANRLRDQPGLDGAVLDQIPAGSVIFVSSGPACADGINWWYVNYNGTLGWTAEGMGSEYFIEPVPQNFVSESGDTETQVEFEGVRFAFPNTLADVTAPLNVSGIIVPPEPVSDDGPYWQGYPRHLELKFEAYSDEEFQNNAYIRVFPAEAYGEMNEYAAEQISSLQDILDSGEMPPAEEALPFLPVYNAAQVFRAQVERLDFENGAGIRFITSFAQDVYPISNERVFYTFQGITDDGAYYVSAQFPLDADALPDEIDPNFDYEEFVANYETYMKDMVDTLDSEPDETFNPVLSDLDSLIRSLNVSSNP